MKTSEQEYLEKRLSELQRQKKQIEKEIERIQKKLRQGVDK